MKKLILILLIFFSFKLFGNEFLIPFEIAGKIGFLDEELNIIYAPKYKYIEDYSKKVMIVKDSSMKTYILLFQNEIPLEEEFTAGVIGDENYYTFISQNREKKSTVYDLSEKIVSSLQGIELTGSKDSTCIKCIDYRNNMREEFIDIYGNSKIESDRFKRVYFAAPSENIYFVKEEGRMVMVNEKGENLNSKKWYVKTERNKLSNGLFSARNENEAGFYNINGDLVIPAEKISYVNFNRNAAPCVIEDGKKKFFDFACGECCESQNWCIINTSNEIVKDKIQVKGISNFSDEGSAIAVDFDYKYFLIDAKGEKITDTVFDKIQESVNGYYRAIKDNVDYLISGTNGTLYKCSDF